METIEQVKNTTLNPKWQERFAFFEKNGAPNTPTYKAAFKSLPFDKRIFANMNFIAFFFGPIYWFILGLWKKNLALIGIFILVSFVIGFIEGLMGITIPMAVDRGINIGFATMYAVSTHYAYYLKCIKGQQSWNPFEGQRMF